MINLKPLAAARLALLIVVGVTALALAWPLTGVAQEKSDPAKDHAKHAQPKEKPADATKDLAKQLADLRAKVAKLEAALDKSHQGKSSGMPGMGGMMGKDMMMGGKKKGMSGMGGMGGMMDMDMMMGGMGGKKMGMDMMDMDSMEMMGMMGMGSMSQGGMKGMKGMGKMQMTSALPGFPGASHIYHIGATDFFLDHPEHITLTTKQKTALGSAKQKALLGKATAQRKIEEAEQELWELTGSDEPDAAKIETKVRAIEKLRGDQRLAFIRSVGEAAKLLTDEQRQVLLGTVQPKADKAHVHPSK
ncbi:MAG: hypothetical protein L0Z62_03475 [Gemmataceae bacterium]|nr:hypothetical protein [Gemmataceae bacterium]